MGNIGIWQLLIVAVIVILLFGTKKLRNLGGDLGSSLKGFKKAMNPEDENKDVESKNLDVKEQADATDETVQSKEKDQV